MPSIAVFGLEILDTVQTFDLYDIQEMSKHLAEQNMSWSVTLPSQSQSPGSKLREMSKFDQGSG